MRVGDLVTYGANLGPQWKKKGMGIVIDVGAFIGVVFPLERDKAPYWYHRDNLEVINEKT